MLRTTRANMVRLGLPVLIVFAILIVVSIVHTRTLPSPSSSPATPTTSEYGEHTLIDSSTQHLLDLAENLGSSPGQLWGYVTVRPNAHSFWWLFPTTHEQGPDNRPLIMWLQGGPGASSTGYGNFELIGPLQKNLKPRDTTWVKDASIIFVDNPVGSGFSYVDDEQAFTTNVDEVADDLMTLLAEFLRENNRYTKVPFYIFGQSYGGKMAAIFAQKLQKEIDRGGIQCQLKGLAMGNSWVSPLDSIRTWGPFLHQMSVVDIAGNAAIMEAAAYCEDAVQRADWLNATYLWRNTQAVLSAYSNNVDFYNILKYRPSVAFSNVSIIYTEDDRYNLTTIAANRLLKENKEVPLGLVMDTVVRNYLRIIPNHVSWGMTAATVFNKHHGDFMKDVVDNVSQLLTYTQLDVVVYQGQLDLICDSKGAMDWVQRMNWSGLTNYNESQRYAVLDPVTSQPEIYVKAYDRFKFYWVLKAGHSVPKDQGAASRRMLTRILDGLDT